MSDPSDSSAAFELRQKYKHFRILVIGRANAGKTTILKRVCNTTEDPRLYDEGKSLLEPTSARGVHDVNRPFVFDSNPKFIFHDSPGFEAGGEEELKAVQKFIADRAKAHELNEQLHAIWFCFGPDKSRPLLPLERKFFDEQRLGNAPVIAIFTKFDDLMIAVWGESRDLVTARQTAQDMLLLRFETPLKQSRFPPKAFVCLEDMHHDDSTHQNRVKNLIEKTTDSLDNLALKILLISVQQNNLELCIQYAVKHELNKKLLSCSPSALVVWLSKWFGHTYNSDEYESKSDEAVPRFAFAVVPRIIGFSRIIGAEFERVTDLVIGSQVFQSLKDAKGLSRLTLTCGILICLENSFWCKAARSVDASAKAFIGSLEEFLATGTKDKLEDDLKTLGEGPDFLPDSYKDQTKEQTAYKSSVLEIILKHRLSHPDIGNMTSQPHASEAPSFATNPPAKSSTTAVMPAPTLDDQHSATEGREPILSAPTGPKFETVAEPSSGDESGSLTDSSTGVPERRKKKGRFSGARNLLKGKLFRKRT